MARTSPFLASTPVSHPKAPMPNDISDVFLAGESTIEDLMVLAKQRLPTPNLQVLSLAAALAYVAEDGGVPNAFVEKAVRGALKMAKGRGQRPN